MSPLLRLLPFQQDRPLEKLIALADAANLGSLLGTVAAEKLIGKDLHED